MLYFNLRKLVPNISRLLLVLSTLTKSSHIIVFISITPALPNLGRITPSESINDNAAVLFKPDVPIEVHTGFLFDVYLID